MQTIGRGRDMATEKKPNPLAEPILIARWRYRRGGDELRISLKEFNGIALIDIRQWWQTDRGEFRPGNKGIACAIKNLPLLAKALNAAHAKASELGLLTPDEPDDGEPT